MRDIHNIVNRKKVILCLGVVGRDGVKSDNVQWSNGEMWGEEGEEGTI